MAAAAAAAADGDATSAVVAENNASMSIGKVPHGRRESLRLWNDGNDWIRKPHREKVNEEHCVMSLSVKRSFTILHVPVFLGARLHVLGLHIGLMAPSTSPSLGPLSLG